MTSEEPARLAEACLRELVGRASFGHIRSVLRPVLTALLHMTSEEPARLAEACLRELVGRASFGHIRSVLRPVLT
ncbi:hypothetical protein PYW07_009345 [Mythimna separata]|uniref:Uncharacterized protein n=1 Tax=Mythimna separata TaxID=271217 RepID=A0AAD7YBT2_MYTSE|nr:hypothetical protein PYW07_009339 [Mythimna separata]KAJ8709974.1 hypothetical protein PYW07_009340 [Mythimna separata]KAJ8709975.1 hypothetical protein PYW07_009341 [Mythimna separata]KAJ8709976.1 hypothetical protein PYW07_009342 [Mythimna separata]KAJ8709977.1 hypothetical protein PYW07_009343 [Mythimna separata]